MFRLSNNKLKEYTLPYDWKISFPKSWQHEFQPEEEGDQYLFYPKNDDLTFRITSFHVFNEEGINAPTEMLREAFLSTVGTLKQKKDFDFKLESFVINCMESVIQEGGKDVYRVCCGIAVEGFLLNVNVFATKKQNIEQSLHYINTIRRI